MAPGDWIASKSPSYIVAYGDKERRKLSVRAEDYDDPEQWLEEHKQEQLQKKRECTRQWRLNNKEKLQEYRKEYAANEDKVEKRKKQNAYYHNRKHTDLNYALGIRLRGRLRSALKRGSKRSKSIDLLGCTVQEWADHLRVTVEQLASGNFEIDHIWPVSLYNLEDEEQQRKAFNYQNTRLATRSENASKHNSIPDLDIAYSVPYELWPG
jgi:hypothetical protein